MTDLAEFLLARIAEDERAVQRSIQVMGSTTQATDRGFAECEAKRRIVERARYADEMWAGSVATDAEDAVDIALDGVLRLLALPYADRPDYQQEWKP